MPGCSKQQHLNPHPQQQQQQQEVQVPVQARQAQRQQQQVPLEVEVRAPARRRRASPVTMGGRQARQSLLGVAACLQQQMGRLLTGQPQSLLRTQHLLLLSLQLAVSRQR